MALLFYIEEGARMKITLSLKKSSDFQRILKKGKWSSGDYLSIYVVSNSQEVNFLGVAVSKKGLNSVKRNRIKRLIREAYRHSEENLKKGYSIVILWKTRNKFEEATFQNIDKDMKKCLKKAGLLVEINE
ncbi:MAG: ribonuclease P protein component [Clostridia bacterium]|nr:ribonuclease P protein component [Clostridia bacterium]